MDKEKILLMEPYMLLSWVNTKLRDEFNNLEDLATSYDVDIDELQGILFNIRYKYNEEINQFLVI